MTDQGEHTDSAILEFVKRAGEGFKPATHPVTGAVFSKLPRPRETEILDAETYDYIVVGAGPSGCVVAGKLAEANPNITVLLLEAGEVVPETSVLNNPRNWRLLQEDPNYMWGYSTTFQEGLYGRRAPLLRGRGIGAGTSLAWTRGGKETFGEWVSRYGCEGWGWNDVLPYFKELEKELCVGAMELVSGEWSEALIAAGKTNAMPHVRSLNEDSGTHHGVAHQQFVLKEGKVQNLFDVFVKRKNLQKVTVKCNAFVTHVLLAARDGSSPTSCVTAYGVQYRPTNNPGGPWIAVKARREVIMTAGAIATPLILMRSGIGNHQFLRECGIEPILDIPSVGHNLSDDLAVTVTYATECELPKEAEMYGFSPVVMSPPGKDITVMVQSNTVPGLWNMPQSWKPGFQLVAYCHSMKSRGCIRLDPNNVEGHPIIDMGYLKEKKDVKRAVKAIQQLRNIGQSESLRPWKPKEAGPGERISSNDGLEAYVRGTAFGAMYPSGTCRMGALSPREKGSSGPVVDPLTLKVYGCERLRIMDSSVLPQNPKGLPAAAVLVVALKGASVLVSGMRHIR